MPEYPQNALLLFHHFIQQQHILFLPDQYVRFDDRRRPESIKAGKLRPTAVMHKNQVNFTVTLTPGTTRPPRNTRFAVHAAANCIDGLNQNSWFLMNYPQTETAGSLSAMRTPQPGPKIPDDLFAEMQAKLNEFIDIQQ